MGSVCCRGPGEEPAGAADAARRCGADVKAAASGHSSGVGNSMHTEAAKRHAL